MAKERVIPTSKSADLITFTIKIEGEKIPEIVEVMTIIVYKEVNRIPTAKLVLIDGDGATQDFELSNQQLFIPGKRIEILAGYHSDESTIFKGIIIKHGIKIRENGTSVLNIDCKDEVVKMTIGRKSKYFYDFKDSDAIEEILETYSLKTDIEETHTSHPGLVQYHSTDWDFLMMRAEVNGKICLVDDGKVSIKNPDFNQKTLVEVFYGENMIEFEAEMDARTQFKKVNAKAWDYAGQKIVDAEAADPGIPENGNLLATKLANVIGLDSFSLQHGGRANDSELQAWADAQLLRNRMSKIRGRVKFQGVSVIKPGELIELGGVGDRFNGKVFVSAVRHQIAEGDWLVDVQFGFNPEWFSETYDIHHPETSGLFPAVRGMQVGLVTQLEGDPDGEDRILVRLPVINHDEQGLWMRVASLDAGENRGSFFRPEIGDEVIVGFINDDPRNAIVVGMLHSSAKPAPITASDDNHQKGFVTRSQMKLFFDDEKKSILVETPKGNKVLLSEDEGAITIEDENGNKIKMESGSIKIESPGDINIKASGDLNLEGTNVNVKAGAQFKAEGSAGAEVSSSGTAVIKGSLVQIN